MSAIPGNPMGTRWVVQSIDRSNDGDGIIWYGRGLGTMFPEPMHASGHTPPELLYERWEDAMAMMPEVARQISLLANPACSNMTYDDLRKADQATPASNPNAYGPLSVPSDVANAIYKAGYRIHGMGYVAIGDTIWLEGNLPCTVAANNHAIGTWSLILKPLAPPVVTPTSPLRELVAAGDALRIAVYRNPTQPHGVNCECRLCEAARRWDLVRDAALKAHDNAALAANPLRSTPGTGLYVEMAPNGNFHVGLTLEHYLLLTREEAAAVVERLGRLAGVSMPAKPQTYNPLYLLTVRRSAGEEAVAGPTADRDKIIKNYEALMQDGYRAVIYTLFQHPVRPGKGSEARP